jgi:hypothetical protein
MIRFILFLMPFIAFGQTKVDYRVFYSKHMAEDEDMIDSIRIGYTDQIPKIVTDKAFSDKYLLRK